MKRSVVLIQLLVTALFAGVGGFVAVSVGGDAVDADRGGMTAAVPMMTEAQVRVGGASASSDLATTTITPVRILDTRVGAAALAGSKVPWGALETRTVEAAGLGTIPEDAVGVVVNVTVLNATAPDTFLTLFPTGTTMPNASTINPQPNEVAFNAATVLLGPDGTFEIYNYSGTVDVIIDVTAYMTRALADNVDEVEDEVGRLQTGELLPLRKPLGLGVSFSPLTSTWSPVYSNDPDGLLGAQIPEGRYSNLAEVALEVVAEEISTGDRRACFRIYSSEIGLIEETEVCVDSSTASSNGLVALTSARVPLPNGNMTLYAQANSCCVNVSYFGFRVYDN